MEFLWKKTRKEITKEKIEDLGNPSKIKIRKGKTKHDKAKKMIDDDRKLTKNVNIFEN